MIFVHFQCIGDGTIGIHNVVTKEGADKPNEICGYAVIPNIDTEPGHFEIYFQDVPVAGDYRVLDTDYENWAAVYSCNNWDVFGFFEYTYLLTRSQTRNETAVSYHKDRMTMKYFHSHSRTLKDVLISDCCSKGSF